MADYYGTDTVVSELREDGLLIIRINRPEVANALNGATSDAMENIMNHAEKDKAVRAIIVTGTGKVFCAGEDLSELSEGGECQTVTEHGFGGITARLCSKPIIAACNGSAAGGGMEIALSCDMVVAAENAKFGCTEVGLGIIASTGGIVRLARDINRKDCMELLLTGKKIKAPEAKELGLINYVVPAEEVMDKAIELAEQVLKLIESAPEGGCPIRQDIPEYIELCRKGKYTEALALITEKNALPFTTGTICAHRCQTKCTRNYYDDPVQIRATKLIAAEKGYDDLMASLKKPEPVTDGRKAAIIGGGPTGIAAAYFLGRAGIPVTVFEQSHKLGGVPRLVIPGFRISEEAIEKDIALMRFYGAEVKLNTPAPSVSELKAMGYTHIFFAVGAGKAGQLDIPGNVVPVIQWLRDLKAGKEVSLGHVAVVGGGNTAMDAARAALRAGALTSTLVYRRTKKYMPADAEELELAMADGVRFLELVAPVEQANGKLRCEVMKLGDPDEKGRRSPVPTGEFTEINCDTVIAAVGERVDSDLFTANGIEVNAKGIPEFRTNLENVFVGGDAMRGPATVVEGIADAQYFANAVIGSVHSVAIPDDAHATRDEAIARKGVLCPPKAGCEGERCLHCNTVCQVCADVCPNRANVVITLPDGRHEILHVDRMCNECGNCAVFCPYDSAPYRNKFTLFLTREGFDESTENQGFLPLEGRKVLVRLDGKVFEADLDGQNQLPADVETFILTVLKDYAYLL